MAHAGKLTRLVCCSVSTPPLSLHSRSVLWPSGTQVYSASDQPIGHVEQSHGDILSDGSSCGAWAMLPNCQADFQRDEEGEESQTNRALAQSPITKPCRRAQGDVPGDRRSSRWNRKQDLTFLLLLEPSSTARLKGRTAKWNEKKEWLWMFECGDPYWKQDFSTNWKGRK